MLYPSLIVFLIEISQDYFYSLRNIANVDRKALEQSCFTAYRMAPSALRSKLLRNVGLINNNARYSRINWKKKCTNWEILEHVIRKQIAK